MTLLSRRGRAQADVSFGAFEVPDQTHYGTTPSDVILEVTAKYDYAANRPPSRWVCLLRVGTTTSDMHELDRVERSEDLPQNDTGTVDLSGSLPSVPDYSLSDFQTTTGNTTSKKLWAELVFEVHDGDSVAARESMLTDAVVTTDGTSLDVSAKVGGLGTVNVTG